MSASYGAADGIPGTDSLWMMARHVNKIWVNQMTTTYYLSALEYQVWYTRNADSSKVITANLRKAQCPDGFHSDHVKQQN